jgi:hypothetical protein
VEPGKEDDLIVCYHGKKNAFYNPGGWAGKMQ